MKGKIRKKTSSVEIKIRTVEKELEELWRSGLSIYKITELIEISKAQLVEILECNLGDYRNYKIRYLFLS